MGTQRIATELMGAPFNANGLADPTQEGPVKERIMHIDMQIRVNPDTSEFLKVIYQGEWIDFNKWNEMQMENEL